MHDNEIARAYKSVNDAYIEPISFIVPRKSEMFQSDIYPPAQGLKPGVSSGEWWDGKDASAPKIDMESLYDGQAPRDAPVSAKSAINTPTPTPTTSAPPPKEAPLSQKQVQTISEEAAKTKSPGLPVNRGPVPSTAESHGSLADAASKFVDKDGSVSSEDEEEASSFEEIAPRTGPPPSVRTDVASRGNLGSTKVALPGLTPQPATPQTSAFSPAIENLRSDGSHAKPGRPELSLQDSLDDIRDLLKKQNQTIAAQSAQLEKLTAEMSELKGRST